MSSPIHPAEDLDAVTAYAPPWAREQAGLELPPTRRNPLRVRPLDVRPAFSGDRAMMDLQRQLALNPDEIPEPPRSAMRSLWPIVARFSAVAAIAAIAAWAMVSLTGTRKTAAELVQVAAPPLVPADNNQVKLEHYRTAADVTPITPAGAFSSVSAPLPAVAPPAASPTPSALTPPAAAVPAPASAPLPQAAPLQPVPAPAPENPPLKLGDDEINMLVKRGQDLLQNGDVASARLLLRRAADAGSAGAALALGSTFDPFMIQKLGAIGIKPDPARAREWYQRAAELGSSAASQQLAKLDQAR